MLTAAAVWGQQGGYARMLRDSTLELSEVDWSYEPARVYIGSPSIVRWHDKLLMTSDRFGAGFHGQRNVSVYSSSDEGETWRFVTWVKSQYWSNIFTFGEEEDVFLLGTSSDGPAPLSISSSKDGGETWRGQVIAGNVKGNWSFQTGPTPTVFLNGRVYRAVERMAPPLFRWPQDFEAVVMSAPQDKLMDASSWTLSEPLKFDLSWIPDNWEPKPDAPGFLEGNMVAMDGKLFNLLRFNTRPYGGNKAILLSFNASRNTLHFEQIVSLPGGHSKFVIGKIPLRDGL